MLFWGKERRRRRRHAVDWDGTLEVRFPDVWEEQPVRLADLSSLGCRFFVPRVFCRGRYLFTEHRAACLVIQIQVPDTPDTPDTTLEGRIAVRWYRWSVERAAFEMAVEFDRLPPETRNRLNALLDGLRKQNGVERGTARHRFLFF